MPQASGKDLNGTASGADPGRPVVAVAVRPERVRRVLWWVTGALVALDAVVSVASAEHLLPYLVTRFFDGDDKINFPTGEKTTLLLAATVLMLGCWVIGRRTGRSTAGGWLLLAAVTGYAFVDESTYLHQSLSTALTDEFHFHGVLKYAWTLVYVPAAAMVGAFLLRNLVQLRPQVRTGLLTGGGVYVIGAMMFEPIKSNISDAQGDGSLAFKLVALVSDSLELVGLTLLVTAMITAMIAEAGGFAFTFPAPARALDPASDRGHGRS